MRGDHDVDDLVDVIEGNRIYTPCLYVLNKIDQITLEELEVIDRMDNYVPICAYHEWNLDGVLEAVWDKLDLIRCALLRTLRRSSAFAPACFCARMLLRRKVSVAASTQWRPGLVPTHTHTCIALV